METAWGREIIKLVKIRFTKFNFDPEAAALQGRDRPGSRQVGLVKTARYRSRNNQLMDH